MRYQPIAAAITTLALLGAGVASASAASWDDEGANDDLTTVENWVGDVAPSYPPAEALEFSLAGDTANQNGGDGFGVASLTFGRDFTLRGQRILLNGNLTVTGPYQVGISVPVDLNALGAVEWDVFSGAAVTVDDVLNIEGNNYLAINTDGLVQFVPGGAINGDAGSNVIQDGTGAVVLAGGGSVTRSRRSASRHAAARAGSRRARTAVTRATCSRSSVEKSGVAIVGGSSPSLKRFTPTTTVSRASTRNWCAYALRAISSWKKPAAMARSAPPNSSTFSISSVAWRSISVVNDSTK